MAQATYSKLRDGSWGVRVVGASVRPGEVVTVEKRSGERKQETVSRVIWSGNGVVLAAIERQARQSGGYGRYDGYDAGRGYDDDMVRCRHCGKRTLGGDDWCMACGRADYE